MTVYWKASRKRWLYDFEEAGQRYEGYCRDPKTGRPAASKTEALKIERTLRAAAQAAGRERLRISSVMTLTEALAAHAARHEGRPHFDNLRAYVLELRAWFGADTPVTAIDEARIAAYVTWARQQPRLVYVGGPRVPRERRLERQYWRPVSDGSRRSDSTINRYLDCLRAALGVAHRARDPVTGESRLPHPPAVAALNVPERIPRPIRDGDLKRILAAAPPHLAKAVLLTILMGFRKSEVFALTVDQVDLEGRGVWLRGEQTKGKRDEFIHASAPALELLAQLREEAIASGTPWLITYQHGRDGELRPIKDPKRAWARVMRDLGINHRFHDTKASFTTALAEQVAGPLVQKLSRHKDFKTTLRYIDLVDQSKRAALEALGTRPAVAGLDLQGELGLAPDSRTKSRTKFPDSAAPIPRKVVSR